MKTRRTLETTIDTMRQWSLRRKAGAAAAVLAMGGATVLGYTTIHDAMNPVIHVGTTDSDVGELADLLESSSLAAYDANGTPTTADEKMMRAVIEVQTEQLLPNGEIDDEEVGQIQYGDATWDALEDSVMGETPENLPDECYKKGDIICVIEDADTPSGTIHIMHDGKQKFSIEDVGTGAPETPTDEGEFSVDPNRMAPVHFSSDSHSEGVPMPNAIFYNGGEAFHFSRLKAEKGDDYPGSGGCVTIGDYEAASQLYRYVGQVARDGRSVKVLVTKR